MAARDDDDDDDDEEGDDAHAATVTDGRERDDTRNAPPPNLRMGRDSKRKFAGLRSDPQRSKNIKKPKKTLKKLGPKGTRH